MNQRVLDQTSVVLVEPQDDINIGTVMRAARNFGIESTRLVGPATADPHKISISAPRCESLIDELVHYDEVEDAIGDCVLTLGFTARRRAANWRVIEPRQAAREVVEATRKGRVGLMFGREDSGLSNRDLDRCHAAVTVPTNPEYSSLNLGQAVSIALWEVFRASQQIDTEGESLEDVDVDSDFEPAHMQGLERMFEQAEEALETIEFFKTETHEHIMRSIRSVLLRADLDSRELAIWLGIFKEVVTYMERTDRS